MFILKIVSIALVGVIAVVYLRSVNGELATLAAVGAGVALVLTIVGYLFTAVDFLRDLSEKCAFIVRKAAQRFARIKLKLTFAPEIRKKISWYPDRVAR